MDPNPLGGGLGGAQVRGRFKVVVKAQGRICTPTPHWCRQKEA
eukprot:CAMPEP_0174371848 /NCGR_PEP_ID=MMETSP0811_2-20130205/101341_1 /TAXON_ID=73025 ORGANISM="Eutreptiella gymnastica-like, Strain CCMP1594" /NCGR_SAMPLE_ID=MMETSP0811_2 /ASSEMBLY_ACC=CAM_ASM_000667 /LENGTH=42 /DNA_ID= /DNA_START= /DNA_END= /DNA_ORIENTATION=